MASAPSRLSLLRIVNMEKKEIIKKVLSESGCLTSNQISCFCKRKYNFDITPSSVSGVLRDMIAKGEAASSNCGNGSTVYWLYSHDFKKE